MDILNRKAILDRVEKSIIGDDGISDIEKNINILNSMVFKGRKPAQVGEIREWARGKMIRTPDGWEPYKEGDSTDKEPEQEEPNEADNLEELSKKLMDDKVMDLLDKGDITIEDVNSMSDEELGQMIADKENMMDEMENPDDEDDSVLSEERENYSPEVSNLAWDKEFRDNVIGTLKDTIGEEEFNKMSSEEIADYVLDSANEFLEQENGIDNKESDEESKYTDAERKMIIEDSIDTIREDLMQSYINDGMSEEEAFDTVDNMDYDGILDAIGGDEKLAEYDMLGDYDNEDDSELVEDNIRNELDIMLNQSEYNSEGTGLTDDDIAGVVSDITGYEDGEDFDKIFNRMKEEYGRKDEINDSEQIYEHGSNDEESYQRLLDEGFTPEFIKDSGIAPSQLLDEFYKDSGAYDEIKAIDEEESKDMIKDKDSGQKKK